MGAQPGSGREQHCPPSTPVLSVRGLRVVYGQGERATTIAVDSLDFELRSGEILAVVGESGSGKTAAALAILGLLPARAVATGEVRLGHRELLGAPARVRHSLRGRHLAAVFQDAMAGLDPVHRVGRQLADAVRAHRPRLPRAAVLTRVESLLTEVGIDEPARRARQYPHEFSGGMRQRAAIALALANDPQVVIADEITTALDVTVQAQVLALLRRIAHQRDAAVIIITHDLAVVADAADRVLVMHAGRAVEQAPVDRILASPQHPRTVELMVAQPPERLAHLAVAGPSLLATIDLTKRYRARRRGADQKAWIDAVADVTLAVHRGETLALVGESGCGKTTVARLVLGLTQPTAGTVLLDGRPLVTVAPAERYRRCQLVFQDPFTALDPRMTARQSVAEPLEVHGAPPVEAAERAGELLARMGLHPDERDRRPAQLSGGQLQRVGLARALALQPEVLVLDEPVSALDAATRAEALTLLTELQLEAGLSYLFISHDLSVVRAMADRVAVMHRGRIVETGSTEQVFGQPGHTYTRRLIAAMPGRKAPRRPPGMERGSGVCES